MADYENVVILNEGLELRTSKSGKTRATIKVTAEPLVHIFDKKAMGGPVAQAIAHHFRERIKGITATVSAATLRYRKEAKKAFERGAPWAMARYAGGKMGPMAPQGGDQAFNDSGRFAASITANASSDDAWRVNVAANRLDERTGNVSRIWAKLVSLVPEFGDPALLMENDVIRKGLEKAQAGMITKERASVGANTLELAMKAIELVAKLAESLDDVAA